MKISKILMTYRKDLVEAPLVDLLDLQIFCLLEPCVKKWVVHIVEELAEVLYKGPFINYVRVF